MRVAVIDASTALKTVLPDPLGEPCRDLLDRLSRDGFELYAPALWAYETTSSLTKAINLGRLTPTQGRQAIEQIRSLGIHLCSPDTTQVRQAFEWTLQLKRAAAYDSFYLALAESLQCDLWTADQRLCNSVASPWVRSAIEPATL